MTELELRALRGDDPLGFLSALGVLRLCVDHLDDGAARLGWADGPWNGARLRTRFSSTEELAQALYAQVETCRALGRVLPGVDGFPLVAGKGESADPMNRRLRFEDGRKLCESVGNGDVGAAWLRSLVSTSGLVKHKGGDGMALDLAPVFDVGPGTVQTARTLTGVLGAVASADAMLAALVRWRRTDYLGAYLDGRADRGAAFNNDPTQKKNSFYGVPGATWLALMATPWFEMRGTTDSGVATVGWRSSPRRFEWPVWKPLLDVRAVAALLDHPKVRHQAAAIGIPGVEAVFRSRRAMAGNYAASLAPAEQIWPTR